MRKFLAATAAIAMAASIAHADPGNGNKGGGGKAQAAQMNGGGGGNASAKPERGQAMKQDRGPQKAADRGPAAKADRAQQQRTERGPANRPSQANRSAHSNRPAQANRAAQADRRAERQAERRIDRSVRDTRGNERAVVERVVDRRVEGANLIRSGDFRDVRGLIDGCPPGLAKKNNGCMPPGLARERSEEFRYRDAYYRPDWWGYDSIGDRVYYDDGYLYRLGSNNSVLGYIPLLGGALSIGNPWPEYYEPVPVPDYYVDYFNLGPQGSYRYADDVLYRVNPQTDAITSIAALLTGDEFAVGQPMPNGYDVYNVPYAYRDRYYDQPDAWYRYSDGYVYQVDPETRLVAAAIELLI